MASLQGLPLTTLVLDDLNRYVTEASLKFLSEMPLTDLSLGRCMSVTDVGLRYLMDLPLKPVKYDGYVNGTLEDMCQALARLKAERLGPQPPLA